MDEQTNTNTQTPDRDFSNAGRNGFRRDFREMKTDGNNGFAGLAQHLVDLAEENS
jgi:hypothetical protein